MIYRHLLRLYEQKPDVSMWPDGKLYKSKERAGRDPVDRTFKFKYFSPIKRPCWISLGAYGNVNTALVQDVEGVSAHSHVVITKHRSLIYPNELDYPFVHALPDSVLDAVNSDQLDRARHSAAKLAVVDALTQYENLEPYYATVARIALKGSFTKH